MNPFRDQEKFMRACDQSTSEMNIDQYSLYLNLIEEEYKELTEAINTHDRKEQLDRSE